MTMRTGLALKEISGKMLELTSGGNVPLSNCSVDPPKERHPPAYESAFKYKLPIVHPITVAT
ncbi:hypothetical protein ACR74Y_09715 [Lacticaseibacillus rhamnosus]|uniref:hypothetical protein n=1 Tax=Lacticaseibacillus rhamnosus TaxID=47715 RepID=UPI00065ADA69|nr:hypothetical protein [Lacticaseibacillus rhamnosus]KMO47515.1 hypothetical protein PY95_04475 [Lacticaseibacillus rhamnosus]OAU03116.1 hypothetical protein PY72_04475 [Lacticaseibacillus rhamnosus]